MRRSRGHHPSEAAHGVGSGGTDLTKHGEADSRHAKSAWDFGKPPSWDALRVTFGDVLVHDGRGRIEAANPPSKVRAGGVGIRHFLDWLTKQADGSDPAAGLLRSALAGARDDAFDDTAYVRTMLTAFERWSTAMQRADVGSRLTATRYGRSAATVLEALGRLPGGRYPRFERSFVSTPSHVGRVTLLGDLGWQETEGLDFAARQRRALQLVQEDATTRFELLEEQFRFGQAVLRGEPASTSSGERARGLIRQVLRDEILFRQGTRASRRTGVASRDVPAPSDMLLDPAIWTAAGLPVRCLASFLDHDAQNVRRALLRYGILPCIGATARAATLMATAMCCETGWNRQSVLDLPRDPFLFRTENEAGIAGSAFIRAFKRRAGHDVLGVLHAEDTKAACQGAASELDSGVPEKGYAMLHANSTSVGRGALRMLETFQEMTDAIRRFDHASFFEDRLFLYLSADAGLAMHDGIFAYRRSLGGVLGRNGVTYYAIRKTYLTLVLKDVGSVEAVRVAAGQASTRVTMESYLNAPDLKREDESSIRFCQETIQALVLDRIEAPTMELVVPAEHKQWFLRLSATSGLAAAVGLTSPGPDAEPGKARLTFYPTPDGLAELYLTHAAVVQARSRLGALRWRVQGLPVMAAVEAIGRELCRHGLVYAYLKAARGTRRRLLLGEVVLPPVLEA